MSNSNLFASSLKCVVINLGEDMGSAAPSGAEFPFSPEMYYVRFYFQQDLLHGCLPYCPPQNLKNILKKVLECQCVRTVGGNTLRCSVLCLPGPAFFIFYVHTMNLLCCLAKGSIRLQCRPATNNMRQRASH